MADRLVVVCDDRDRGIARRNFGSKVILPGDKTAGIHLGADDVVLMPGWSSILRSDAHRSWLVTDVMVRFRPGEMAKMSARFQRAAQECSMGSALGIG